MPLTLNTGIFTGLDYGSLIGKIMAAESQPLQGLSVKKSSYQAKISAFGTLKSSLASLKGAVKDLQGLSTNVMKATSSDTTVLSATGGSTATAGVYAITVNRLATSQSIYSSGYASDTGAVADLSGSTTQKLKIQTGGGAVKEITVTAANNTLAGLRDAINGAGAGVKASIVNAGFEITSANNTIVFNDGSNRTATLAAGTYSPQELANELKRALEAANGGADTYTVSYDTSSRKFSIANDAGNANAIDMLWENAGSTAASTLGFTATDHASIAAGAAQTGDNDAGGYRLVLAAEATGAANRIRIWADENNDGVYGGGTETDATGLSKLAFDPGYDASGNVSGGVANMSQSQAALSSSLVINGLTASRDTNTITDLIPGVTLTLLKTSATSATLTVARDTQAIMDKVNGFAGAYNSAVSLARGLASTGSKGQKALFTGDHTVGGIVDGLRKNSTTRYGEYTPASLGLSHSKEGVLELNTSVLNNFLGKDLDGVVATLDAMAKSMEGTLSFFINNALPTRTEGLNKSISRVDDQVAGLQRRLSLTEAQLVKRFNLLEQTIGQLQSSGGAFSRQGGGNSGPGGG